MSKKRMGNVPQGLDGFLRKTSRDDNVPVDELKQIEITKLVSHPRNNKLLPQLSKSELLRLKDRILKYGFNEAIEINSKNIILDGHHRIRILREYYKELKIDKVPYRVIDIPEEEEEHYIISKNFDRRQLTRLMQSYIRGLQYNQIKQEGFKGNQYTVDSVEGQNVPNQKRSSTDIAGYYNVSEKTIRRDGEFAIACNKIIKNTSNDFVFKLLNGNINTDKKSIIELSNSDINTQVEISRAIMDTKTLDNDITLKALLNKFSTKLQKDVSTLKTKTASFKIDSKFHDKIKRIAEKENLNLSELIIKALQKYIDNRGKD